jgi:cytoskeletal protein CcmA (bactofilin family)/DNA-directed RNA polymerase subunit RPC12/RpoP
MPLLPRKAPFRCPHCGFVQEESEHLISTYCRSCGRHYEVVSNSESRKPSNRLHLVPNAIWRHATSPPGRTIRCYRCGKIHEVSEHARTTFCPHCNTAIDLGNATISIVTSRPIDMRGNLTITHSGHVCSALTVCSEASVAGRISGTFICESTLRLECSGRLNCQIRAKSMVIEERARLKLTYPTRSGDLMVHGQAAGNFDCAGTIWIASGGLIEGRISASSVVVEYGGTLLAETSIHPRAKQRSLKLEDEFDIFAANRPLPAY